MRKTLHTFKVEYLQVLDENGNVDSKLLPKISDAKLIEMYSTMVLARHFDAKMLALQRQGRIATFASLKGQEGCQAAAIACIKEDDWVVPAFREVAALIARGIDMKNILLYNGGDERGSAAEGEQRDLPNAVPVGSQTCHAAGIALGMKLRKTKNVVVTFFGDGATSEGDFHEALNFAGVFQAPCIFICQNNQWAISTPVSKQTHAATIAQKAIAYGMPGIRVDGNDVFGTYVAVKEAVERARKGQGPTLIECVTYRLSDHTTADDASRYRTEKEVKSWEKKEPIRRFKKYLIKAKKWSEKKEKELLAECEKKINDAVARYEASDMPAIDDMFAYIYAELTAPLKEQLEYAKSVSK